MEFTKVIEFEYIETEYKLLLEVDRLTEEELLDLDYVEDRLETHYEILWRSNLSK
jgi:hypothetical protein